MTIEEAAAAEAGGAPHVLDGLVAMTSEARTALVGIATEDSGLLHTVEWMVPAGKSIGEVVREALIHATETLSRESSRVKTELLKLAA